MNNRILIVDDSESIRHFLKSLLEEEGCDVCEAKTAEEALVVLKEFDPAVAVVDVVLPGMDGFQLLNQIKLHSKTTEVLVISSHASFERAERAIRQGAFGYLVKPFEDIEDTWKTIKNALDRHRGVEEDRPPLSEPAPQTC